MYLAVMVGKLAENEFAENTKSDSGRSDESSEHASGSDEEEDFESDGENDIEANDPVTLDTIWRRHIGHSGHITDIRNTRAKPQPAVGLWRCLWRKLRLGYRISSEVRRHAFLE